MSALEKRNNNAEAIERLPLCGKRGKGLHALVDAELFPALSELKWYLGRNGYVCLAHPVEGRIYLHRIVLGAVKGQICDHANGVKLDCRNANLRFATSSENNRNVGRRSHSRQPYKGIRLTAEGRWKARIRRDGKEIHLGHFDTPEEAAIAYNEAAETMFGAFARKVIL